MMSIMMKNMNKKSRIKNNNKSHKEKLNRKKLQLSLQKKFPSQNNSNCQSSKTINSIMTVLQTEVCEMKAQKIPQQIMIIIMNSSLHSFFYSFLDVYPLLHEFQEINSSKFYIYNLKFLIIINKLKLKLYMLLNKSKESINIMQSNSKIGTKSRIIGSQLNNPSNVNINLKPTKSQLSSNDNYQAQLGKNNFNNNQLNHSQFKNSKNDLNSLPNSFSNVIRHKKKPVCPKYIPKGRQIIPYRLIINKFSNVAISKKSPQNYIFLQMYVTLYTNQGQIIGQTYNYQSEEAFVKKQENRYQFPSIFYYHSKIDKNSQSVSLMIRVCALEMKGKVVQIIHQLGIFRVENPFIQQNHRSIPLIKNMSELDLLLSEESLTNLSKGNQCVTVDYNVQSYIELKLLTKFIPQNCIVSHNDYIGGIQGGHLSNTPQYMQIIESSMVNIKATFLQIHIPEKFQMELLAQLKKYSNNAFGTTPQIKNRKVVIGSFNHFQLISPFSRKLELVSKQATGQWRISIFQAIRNEQTVALSYYIDNQNDVILVSLIYEVNGKQLEVCQYILRPIINGEAQEISETMGVQKMGNMSLTVSKVNVKCEKKPMILMEYQSEDFLDEQNVNLSNNDLRKSAIFMNNRSSHKLLQDKNQQLKEKQRLLEELMYQKLNLQKQRNIMDRLKTQSHTHYQEQFQRKFQIQRQNLHRRQQLLEQQYKQQVQKQIRQKFQMEEQIRLMKEKLKEIQSNRVSNMQSVYEQEHEPVQPFRSRPYRSDASQKGQLKLNQNMGIVRQKIDPAYLVQPEHQMPVAKVRQILKKNKVDKQVIELSKAQFNRSSKFIFTFSSILWYDGIEPPKTIFFLIRFFNFPQYKTDTLTYLQSDSANGHSQLIRLNNYTYNYQNVQPSYTFTVDPSQYKSASTIQSDLVDYLSENNAIIDIFDGDTHIYLGQLNIKLANLIRGKKNMAFLAKEYSLIKIKTKQTIGLIQILIKNEEDVCAQQISLKYQKKQNQLKKKIISHAPMVIPKQQNLLESKNTQKIITSSKGFAGQMSRQEERIKLFKQKQMLKTFQKSSNNFMTVPQEQKKSVLNKIISYKQKKMPQFIKTVYSGLLHQNITISSQFGKACTFPYTFINQSQVGSSYKIVIHDSNQSLQQSSFIQSQLNIVKDAAEWRYFVKNKSYTEPKIYEFVNQDNIFYLNAGESVPLVFKYLTFKKVPKVKTQKIINVTIVKVDSDWIAGGFSLTVQPHQQITHHSYILYQPGNQVVDLILPVIYSKTDEYSSSSVKKLHLTSQDQFTEAQWLNQYQILLRMKTPQIMHKTTFHLLLYDDEYFDKLKQNWLIVLNSYQGICSNSRIDSSTKFKITLPFQMIPASLGLNFHSNSLSNCLLLHSSDPNLLFNSNKIYVDFAKIQEKGGFQIWCQLLASGNLKKQIEITCTTADNNDLVYGWVLQVYPYIPRRNV